jgi:SAM-dependent methyltransferase
VIGKVVRRLAGPLEPHLADLYRGFFFDVDDFARRIAELGAAKLVVEIGCGEGALITALARRMPHSRFVGIDVAPQVGRLFVGDTSRVDFACSPADAVAGRYEGQADLVIICDVMHHASAADQQALWQSAARMARRPGARMVLKEWLKNPAPIYYLGYASDRFITGDRIRYQPRSHWIDAIGSQGWGVETEWPLAPWKTNHAFVLKRAAA